MEKTDCEELRREIKAVADRVLALRAPGDDIYNVPGEAIANATLAYRHLEDASMRLGKAIQALDGGVSVYDRTQVTGA
jgi:hypothetical protein